MIITSSPTAEIATPAPARTFHAPSARSNAHKERNAEAISHPNTKGKFHPEVTNPHQP